MKMKKSLQALIEKYPNFPAKKNPRGQTKNQGHYKTERGLRRGKIDRFSDFFSFFDVR